MGTAGPREQAKMLSLRQHHPGGSRDPAEPQTPACCRWLLNQGRFRKHQGEAAAVRDQGSNERLTPSHINARAGGAGWAADPHGLGQALLSPSWHSPTSSRDPLRAPPALPSWQRVRGAPVGWARRPRSQSIAGKQLKNNRKERRNQRREGRGNATGLCWETQNLCATERGRAQERRSKSRAGLGGSGQRGPNLSCAQLQLRPAKQNLLARRSGSGTAGKSAAGQEWCINRASYGVISRSRSRRA